MTAVELADLPLIVVPVCCVVASVALWVAGRKDMRK